MLHSVRLPERGRAVGIGVDLVALDRFEREVSYAGFRFLARVFTRGEIAIYRRRRSHLAKVFAVKEAVSKALGTGMRGVDWQDIDVRLGDGTQVGIRLRGRANHVAKALLVARWTVVSELVEQTAVACAIAIADETTQQREISSDG